MIQITVYGSPAPQGSKKFMGIKGGKGILVESSKAVKPWRQAVVWAAREALNGPYHEYLSLCGPVSVTMIFTLRKPTSAPKRRKSWPDKKPDLSKLVRATEDALTDSGIWEDDARVVELTAAKCFPGEHPLALGSPGATIRIERIEP